VIPADSFPGPAGILLHRKLLLMPRGHHAFQSIPGGSPVSVFTFDANPALVCCAEYRTVMIRVNIELRREIAGAIF
jgi:hypothetical protein